MLGNTCHLLLPPIHVLSCLLQERDRAASATDSSTRLRVLKQQLAVKEEQLNLMLTGPRGRPLLMLLGVDAMPAVGSVKAAAEAALRSKQHEITDRAKQIRDLQNQVAQIE